MNLVWSQEAYTGEFRRRVEEEQGCVRMRLPLLQAAVALRSEDKPRGFRVLLPRRVFERTFALLGPVRRLSKDYTRGFPR